MGDGFKAMFTGDDNEYERELKAAMSSATARRNDFAGTVLRMTDAQAAFSRSFQREMSRLIGAAAAGGLIPSDGDDDAYTMRMVLRAAARQIASCVLVAGSQVATIADWSPEEIAAGHTRAEAVQQAFYDSTRIVLDEIALSLEHLTPDVLAGLLKMANPLN